MFQSAVGSIDVSQQQSREVVGRLLHLSVPEPKETELTETERIALYCIEMIAKEGRAVDQYEIAAAIGSENVNGGTMAGVVNRLIAKGYVEHVLGFPIQRGMWLRIVATGQQTAEPKCTSPHWRYRKEAVPSPAIHQVRERNITLARMIEDKARALNMPISEFLMDCVYVGFNEIAAED